MLQPHSQHKLAKPFYLIFLIPFLGQLQVMHIEHKYPLVPRVPSSSLVQLELGRFGSGVLSSVMLVGVLVGIRAHHRCNPPRIIGQPNF